MTKHVVFIHGLWVHSTAWKPWQDLFETRGYTTSAPGWPGDQDTVAATRAHPDGLNNQGIAEICHHYADLIEKLEDKPIVVGHSFGGLVAQELLANNIVAAAVAIDPAPVKGVFVLPFSQLKSSFPVLSNPGNRSKTVALDQKQFKYAFGNTLTDNESNALHAAWTIPGPGKPLFEDATANFVRNSPAQVDTHTAVRGPLLLTSGTEDHTVPRSVTLAVSKLYADNAASVTDLHEYEGKGHSLTLDHGWNDVAVDVLTWLDGKGFGPA